MDTNMLDIVRASLPRNRNELEALEKLVGVPAGTMEKIARGYTKNPRYETIHKLYDHFKSVDVEHG